MLKRFGLEVLVFVRVDEVEDNVVVGVRVWGVCGVVRLFEVKRDDVVEKVEGEVELGVKVGFGGNEMLLMGLWWFEVRGERFGDLVEGSEGEVGEVVKREERFVRVEGEFDRGWFMKDFSMVNDEWVRI